MSTKIALPGDYIHARRRELGITKGQAARMLGLSDTEYRQIERDSKRPSEPTLAAIARLLRIDPARLARRYP